MGINVKGSKGAVHMYPWLANLTGQLVEDRRGCVELMRLTFTAATYYYYYYYCCPLHCSRLFAAPKHHSQAPQCCQAPAR